MNKYLLVDSERLMYVAKMKPIEIELGRYRLTDDKRKALKVDKDTAEEYATTYKEHGYYLDLVETK